MKYKIEQISYFLGFQSIRKIYIPLSFHKLSTMFPLTFHYGLKAVLNKYAEIVRQ